MTRKAIPTGELLPAVLTLLLALGCGAAGDAPSVAEAQQKAEAKPVEPFAGKLALDPKWKAGDRVAYEIVKTRKRVRTNGRNVDATSRTPLTIEVREASEDGFLLACVYGKTAFDDPRQLEHPLVKQLVDIFAGQTLLVEVQWPGAITGVRNWREVQSGVAKATELMIAELERSGADEQMTRAIRDTVAAMSSSPGQITQSVTKDLGLLLLPVGHEFEGAKPIELDDLLASPIGGEPMPSKARLALVGIAPDSQTAVVSWSQTIDPEAARRVAEGLVREMASRVGKPMPEGEALPAFDIKDSAEYRVDLATGWPVELTHTRTVVSGADSQVDTTSMRRTGQQDR